MTRFKLHLCMKVPSSIWLGNSLASYPAGNLFEWMALLMGQTGSHSHLELHHWHGRDGWLYRVWTQPWSHQVLKGAVSYWKRWPFLDINVRSVQVDTFWWNGVKLTGPSLLALHCEILQLTDGQNQPIVWTVWVVDVQMMGPSPIQAPIYPSSITEP